MAQGRMLKKNISNSKKLASLDNDTERLIYTWLLIHLDVEGRFSADPFVIKGNVFPRIKKISIKKIEKGLESLKKAKLLILYRVDNDKYLQYFKFNDMQNLRKDRESPSDIPPPPPDLLRSNSRPDPGQVKLSKDKLREVKVNKISALKKDLIKKKVIR